MISSSSLGFFCLRLVSEEASQFKTLEEKALPLTRKDEKGGSLYGWS